MSSLGVRLSRISHSALAFALTLWVANWAVANIDLSHGSGYLLVAGAFVLSTLWRPAQGRS